MTKKLRLELVEQVAGLQDRLDGLAARIEMMQITYARTPVFQPSESPFTRPIARPLRHFLNGSWPVRDGNSYPRFDTTRHQGPLGGYESYVRRSPPATE